MYHTQINMRFSTIAFKMFKANIRKYRLFIICNLSSIAILYSFISISVNEQFMDSSIVDPMISSNIYAPTLLLLIFTGIFIPYSQNVFIKDRQKDYGILLTIGMSENEVRNSVLIENVALCAISLITGLVIGTFLSLFFLFFISNVIGINNITITISILPYKLTIIYVFAVFIISLIVNVYGIIKSSIYEKIKFTEKSEIGKHYDIKFIYAGIILIIMAFAVMIFFYHVNSNIWFESLLLCILGSALIFFNGESLIEHFQTNHYKKYIENIFLFSDLKYYYGKNKKIFFATTWIFFSIIFFVMFSLVTYPNFKNNAISYHPFSMAYGEVKDHFNPLDDDEIKSITEENGNSITKIDSVKFVRDNNFSVFCIDDINRVLNTDYSISSKSYIYVYPYDMNDGYEHNINRTTPSINIDSNTESKEFTIQDTIIVPLLGEINCISDNILLVNREDYDWISSNSTDFYLKVTLHLYNFNDWMSSNIIVNQVWNKLMEKNNIDENDTFYNISSRIGAYNIALKSSNFLIFANIYVCILLYFAAIIMIHFKLTMEYEDEKKKYFSLYRIGIIRSEIKKNLSQKILVIYSISPVYAIIISILYSYYTNSSYGYGFVAVFYAIITSFVFLILHLIVYKLYLNNYYRMVLSELNLN